MKRAQPFVESYWRFFWDYKWCWLLGIALWAGVIGVTIWIWGML